MIGRADERIAADGAQREILALLVVFRLTHRRGRDVLDAQHAVDRTPVGLLDAGVAVVVLGLLLGRRQTIWPTVNTSISRPSAAASALMSAIIFLVASTPPWRDA